MVRKKKLELSIHSRKAAFLLLWNNKENGRPARGAFGEVAGLFSVAKSTIWTLWRDIKNKIDDLVNNGTEEPDDIELILFNDIEFYESGRKNSGRKNKWNIVAMKQEVRAMPLSNRQTITQLARILRMNCFYKD